MELRNLKGIGEKTEQLFMKLGIESVEDLLNYYPRSYDTYESPVTVKELDNQIVIAIEAMVVKKPDLLKKGRLQMVRANLRDKNGDAITAVWFHMPYVRQTLIAGSKYVFRGRIKRKRGMIELQQPEIFPLAKYEEKLSFMQPIYRLTKGITNNTIQKAIQTAFNQNAVLDEWVSQDIRIQYNLMEQMQALQVIHFPTNPQEIIKARHRLVFDEFFLFIYTLRQMRNHTVEKENGYVIQPDDRTEAFIRQLPFQLTNGQRDVVGQIREDMKSGRRMSRLIQGDVGSGKTIVSVIALMDVIYAGYQGALMAPTEVLARQHYESVTKMFKKYGIDIQVALLTGSMTAKEKRIVYEQMISGEAQLIIGTHALIQEKAEYHNLGLVITDEQHRFGVRQRENLAKKGNEPHIIVMSATPIPRSLAIVIYGDLDVSVIRELPAERLPIKNCVVDTNFRPQAYQFIQKQVAIGHQAYIICPMVEENEELDIENVIDYAKMLKEELPPTIQVEYLHGKMKNEEKNEIMERFHANKTQVLVSTTVVEVGVNVPNATVMMVENAERFGLAGLHQLRGRVGRGSAQSYCIFMSGSKKKETKERLEILNQSNDGFEIAQKDLELRGPGEFFGMRQSGDLNFKIGDIFTDANVIAQVSEVIKKIEQGQIELSEENQAILDKKILEYEKKALSKINL